MSEETQAEGQVTEQPAAAEPAQESATDALLRLMGDEPESPTEEAPEGETAETEGADAPEAEPETASSEVEVEYDGEVFKVPPKLKDALLRQSDYTRKTQEVAEQRKLLETTAKQIELTRQFQTQHAEDLAQLKSLDSKLEEFKQVDWQRAMDSDLVTATKAFAQYQQLREVRNAKASEVSAAEQSFQQQVNQTRQELLQRGAEELKKRIPDLTQEGKSAIANTAMNLGFTQDEVSQMVDPRAVHALYLANKYLELQKAKPDLTKKVTSLPKPVRPGSSQPAVTDQEIQQKKAMSRLKQSGSPDAARELLMHRLK